MKESSYMLFRKNSNDCSGTQNTRQSCCHSLVDIVVLGIFLNMGSTLNFLKCEFIAAKEAVGYLRLNFEGNNFSPLSLEFLF